MSGTKCFFILLILVLVSGMGCALREAAVPKSDEVRMILHRKGKRFVLDKETPFFSEILMESRNLFETANTTYTTFPTEEWVDKTRRKQTALEVIWPEIETTRITFNQKKVYYARILIPLSGRWANGTIFHYGIPEHTLFERYDGRIPGKSEADRHAFVVSNGPGVLVNTRGLSALRELLWKAGMGTDTPEKESEFWETQEPNQEEK